MNKTFAIALLLAAILPADARSPTATAPLTVFSALTPGQTPPPSFRIVSVPNIKGNEFSLVSDGGATVLRVDSERSAGSVALPLTLPVGATEKILEWRWKVSRVLDNADMTTKAGDDFAARVYVFFDVPMASLSFADRTRLRLARMIAGADVPTAAICYVWDNKQRPGFSQWSPYTNRVRVIVLESGAANAGKWMNASRDLAADFRSAFSVAAPAVTGIAVGSDTDNTGERVVTWYGDVTLKTR